MTSTKHIITELTLQELERKDGEVEMLNEKIAELENELKQNGDYKVLKDRKRGNMIIPEIISNPDSARRLSPKYKSRMNMETSGYVLLQNYISKYICSFPQFQKRMFIWKIIYS